MYTYKLSSCFFLASNSSCVIAPMSSKPLSFLISSSGSVAGDDCGVRCALVVDGFALFFCTITDNIAVNLFVFSTPALAIIPSVLTVSGTNTISKLDPSLKLIVTPR